MMTWIHANDKEHIFQFQFMQNERVEMCRVTLIEKKGPDETYKIKVLNHESELTVTRIDSAKYVAHERLKSMLTTIIEGMY